MTDISHGGDNRFVYFYFHIHLLIAFSIMFLPTICRMPSMSCCRSSGVAHVTYLSTTCSMFFPALTSRTILTINTSPFIICLLSACMPSQRACGTAWQFRGSSPERRCRSLRLRPPRRHYSRCRPSHCRTRKEPSCYCLSPQASPGYGACISGRWSE